MTINLIIPPELREVLKTIKRKDKRNSLLLIYNALIYKDKKYNKINNNLFFPIPSAYLEKINSRYYKLINILLDNDIIEYKTINNGYKDIDLFTDELYSKKYYNTHTGQCMNYRFIIDIEKGREIQINFPDFLYENENWYKITKKSLLEIMLPINIIRDSFSRRLHTSITSNTHIVNFESYKNYLSALGGYTSIDIKECQPTLLFHFLKDKIVIDNNYTPYTIYSQINNDRDEAKNEFVTWLNCEPNKMSRHINILFPILSDFIINYKNKNGYKSLGSKLQNIEAKIVIDDLLDNIVDGLDIKFCLTVHDSLIVRDEDVDKVSEWVEGKYKQLEFKKEKI